MKITKVKVAKVSDIPQGKAKAFKVEKEEVAVYHTESGEWYATSDICTHEYCNLSYGKVSAHEVECDCHGSKFDIRTGKVLSPPAFEDVKTFKVSVEGEDVYIEG